MGNGYYGNIKTTRNKIVTQVTLAMNGTIKEQCEKLIRDYIKTIIYEQAPQGRNYDRTFELLNSVRTELIPIMGEGTEGLMLNLYIDDSWHSGRMWYDASGDGFSVEENDVVTISTVARILNENLNKGRKDNTAFMDMAIDEMERTLFHINELIRYLETRGFVIKK